MPDKTPTPDPDLLDALIGRMQEKTPDRLERQMREAGEIKAQAEASSHNRLEEMWMQEHERQQTIATQQAEQRRQEQMLMRYALIGGAIIILAFVILAFVLAYA